MLTPWLLFVLVPAQSDPLAAELPRIPPRSPEEALRSFRIAEGFTIELAAAEPEVVDPVDAAFDGDGRLWVVEMRDYPFTLDAENLTQSEEARTEPSGRIRVLSDRDGDGRFESAAVFADGLHWPTGIALWKGGAFVTAAPDILYLRDDDGDGKADTRRVVWTGFGRKNVQALLNNLKWGPDGYLYGSSGMNDARVTPGEAAAVENGSPAPVILRGRDFRFRPEGGPLEPLAGGGQFGLSFGLHGERFVCSNSDHLRHVVLDGRASERASSAGAPSGSVSIAEDGPAAPVFRASPAEPWRLVRTRERASSPDAKAHYPATELVPIGFFTSAAGVTIYRGDAFPPEFQGDAFIGDVGGNLVHRKRLIPAGATFTARRAESERDREFLVSTDNWFRPVNFTEGPDGALYVLDMYRETIEHPYSIPEHIKEHLHLTSGNDRGRIWRIAPRGFRRPAGASNPGLSRSPPEELVPLLSHPSAWWRETAARLLIEKLGGRPGAPRAESVEVPTLRAVALSARSSEGRIQALQVLAALGMLGAGEIAPALVDPSPRVREEALRLSEGRRTAALLAKMLPLAADPDPRVRFRLAIALAPEASPDPPDRVSLPALALLARSDGADPWMRAAILGSAAGRAGDLLGALAENLAGAGGGSTGSGRGAGGAGGSSPASLGEGARAILPPLSLLVGSQKKTGDLARALAAAARLVSVIPGAGGSEGAIQILSSLAEGLRRSGGDLAALLASPPEPLAAAAAGVAPLLEEAARRARDRALPAARRVEAAAVVAITPAAGSLELLALLIDAAEPPLLQTAAAGAISRSPSPRAGELLAASWGRAGPEGRREILEALLAREERIALLLAAIADGSIPARSIDPARRKQLLEHRRAEIREKSAALLAREVPGDRRTAIESRRGALALPSDRARGLGVYRRACAACHRLGEEGRAVGPDLASVQNRSSEALLESILDPGREFLPAYAAYLVLTRDGRSATGLIAAESEATLTLRRAEGVEETFPRAAILEARDTGLSLMPEGLEKDLSAQDLADLIALILAPVTSPAKR